MWPRNVDKKKATEKKCLESFQMWVWRGLLKVSWRKHKSNEEVIKTAERLEKETLDTEAIQMDRTCFVGRRITERCNSESM